MDFFGLIEHFFHRVNFLLLGQNNQNQQIIYYMFII